MLSLTLFLSLLFRYAGTLSIINIPSAIKPIPEPSFLYTWMDDHDEKQMIVMLRKLLKEHPYLYNIQVRFTACQ